MPPTQPSRPRAHSQTLPLSELWLPQLERGEQSLCPRAFGRGHLGGFLGRALAEPLPVTLALSQQPVPEQLRVQVSRVSMHDYEALHYDKEQLKEACERHAGLRGPGERKSH